MQKEKADNQATKISNLNKMIKTLQLETETCTQEIIRIKDIVTKLKALNKIAVHGIEDKY